MKAWDELHEIGRRDPTVAAALVLIQMTGRSHDVLLRLAVVLAREKARLLETAQRAAAGLPYVVEAVAAEQAGEEEKARGSRE